MADEFIVIIISDCGVVVTAVIQEKGRKEINRKNNKQPATSSSFQQLSSSHYGRLLVNRSEKGVIIFKDLTFLSCDVSECCL
ncbi:MAG: hypothetical protein ACI90V_000389 [Bacillariaceae sp.]|jgi:hypothetical protein